MILSHWQGSSWSFSNDPCRLAKTMVDIAQATPLKMSVKACLTCGAVSAGVIGFNRFNYDVWGPSLTQSASILSSK